MDREPEYMIVAAVIATAVLFGFLDIVLFAGSYMNCGLGENTGDPAAGEVCDSQLYFAPLLAIGYMIGGAALSGLRGGLALLVGGVAVGVAFSFSSWQDLSPTLLRLEISLAPVAAAVAVTWILVSKASTTRRPQR